MLSILLLIALVPLAGGDSQTIPDARDVEVIESVIDAEEEHIYATKHYFKCLLLFDRKSAVALLGHFLDRASETRVVTSLEDAWRTFQDQQDVIRRTRCVIGLLWHPQQQDVELMETLLLERTTKFLIIMSNDPRSTFTTEIRSLVIRPTFQDNLKSYSMDLLCPHCHNTSEYKDVASFDDSNNFDHGKTICPLHPLEGCTDVRVAFIGVRPFIQFNAANASDPAGADVALVRLVAARLGFAPVFLPQRSYGEFDAATRTASGMIAAVRADAADMGVGGISVTATRWMAVHYSRPYMGTEYAYAGTVPRPMDPFMNGVRVFDRYIWAWLVFVVVLLCFVITAFHYSYKCSPYLPNPKERTKNYGDFLLVSIAVLTGQTLAINPFPKMNKTKHCLFGGEGGFVVMSTWLLGALIITSAYKSMILAFLVKVDYEKPLTTTEAVLASGKILCIAKDTSISRAFSSSPNPLHLQAYEKAQVEETLYSLEKGSFPPDLRQRLDNEGGVFVSFAEGNVTGYTFSPSQEVILSANQAFIFNKRRAWKRAFDHHLTWLRETGWVKKLLRDFDPKRGRPPPIASLAEVSAREQPAAVLTLNHVKGSIAFLLIGQALAAVVLGIEIYVSKAGSMRRGEGWSFTKVYPMDA